LFALNFYKSRVIPGFFACRTEKILVKFKKNYYSFLAVNTFTKDYAMPGL